MSSTAADYMAQALAQAAVKRIYGVVGDSLNGFRGTSVVSLKLALKALLDTSPR